jgi:hypothetical protein
MRPRALLASAAALLLLAGSQARPAAADAVPSLDLRGFTAPTDPGSGMYVQPADSPGTGEWSVGLFTSYAFRPVTLRDAKTDAIVFDVIKNQISGDLVGGVGLWHRLYLGLDLPVLLYQTGDAPTAAATAAIGAYQLPAQAFGDLGLDAKLTLVRPTAGDLGFALALHERLSIPTGDTASFLGEGAATNEARFLAEYRVAAIGVHATLGFLVRGHVESFACDGVAATACPARFGDEIPFGLGVSFKPQSLGIDPKGRMTWFLEMNGHLPAWPIAPFKSTAASSAQLDAAARVALGGDVSLLAGVQTGLIPGVGDPQFRGLLAVTWAPRNHDRDGDGIPDDVDQCPDLPEDYDGFQDLDGCPDNDNDADGIPDKLDKCPNTKEDYDGYQDADGCPDPDNDQDHIPDTEDACPNEPGPPSPDPKKNGCPIGDRDGDGIPDDKDACPDEPGPTNADPKLNGCPPDKDSDGDGIPDREDACPSIKGVRSPNPRENGCPDPDPDKDTFIGDDDKCPNDAETWNGYQDADGCPDQAPPGKTKKIVTVKAGPKGESIVVEQAIAFTPTNEIEAPSLLTLRAVAAELVRHPGWKVLVGVRPASTTAGASDTRADAHAKAIVAALRRYARWDQVAETATWDTVKSAPRAAELGVGFVLVTPPPSSRKQ